MAEIRNPAVALRLFGTDLDPDEISALLQCPPSTSYRMGDIVKTDASKPGLQRKTGGWVLETKASPSKSLDEKLRELIGMVANAPATWMALRKRFDIDVFCGIFMDSSTEGTTIAPETLGRLASMCLHLSLVIYAPTGGSDIA